MQQRAQAASRVRGEHRARAQARAVVVDMEEGVVNAMLKVCPRLRLPACAAASLRF